MTENDTLMLSGSAELSIKVEHFRLLWLFTLYNNTQDGAKPFSNHHINCHNPTQLNSIQSWVGLILLCKTTTTNHNRIPLFLSSYTTKLSMQPNQKIHAKKTGSTSTRRFMHRTKICFFQPQPTKQKQSNRLWHSSG